MAPRPWNQLPIHASDEPLLELPEALLRLVPHPYQALGAPYGDGLSPFRLREAVLRRLMLAQESLAARSGGWRLAIFDAWRPLAVQAFMVEHAFEAECRRRGLDPHGPDIQSPDPQFPDPRNEVRELVARFWAAPSADPAMPPPHSTGAAVDLTLADAEGSVLAMGGEIDALGPESEPDHYASNRASDRSDGACEAASWQQRRQLLRLVMEQAGFAQHPNEWWHFSFGDQLWAWRRNEPAAFYGRVLG